MDLQTRLIMPLEFPVFYNSELWLNSSKVLDLGTGYGDYIAKLSEAFPEKQFVGIDCNDEYISEASRTYGKSHSNLKFFTSDILDFKDQYPCVLARLVAQHMPNLEAFINHVADILEPNGIFVNIEPSDRLRIYYPPCKPMKRLFLKFAEHQASTGKYRDAGYRLQSLAPQAGLALHHETHIIVPSTLPGYKPLFTRFHELIFELFSEEYSLDFDKEEMRSAWREWASVEHGYTQLAMHVAFYRKTS